LFFLDSLVEHLAAGDSQLTVTLEHYLLDNSWAGRAKAMAGLTASTSLSG